MMLGAGSLISEDSESMVVLLLGRTIQGLGAGGLTALSYVVYGDLDHSHRKSVHKQVSVNFLTAISCSVALGTVCGPLIGAALSNGSDWVRSKVVYQSHRILNICSDGSSGSICHSALS